MMTLNNFRMFSDRRSLVAQTHGFPSSQIDQLIQYKLDNNILVSCIYTREDFCIIIASLLRQLQPYLSVNLFLPQVLPRLDIIIKNAHHLDELLWLASQSNALYNMLVEHLKTSLMFDKLITSLHDLKTACGANSDHGLLSVQQIILLLNALPPGKLYLFIQGKQQVFDLLATLKLQALPMFEQLSPATIHAFCAPLAIPRRGLNSSLLFSRQLTLQQQESIRHWMNHSSPITFASLVEKIALFSSRLLNYSLQQLNLNRIKLLILNAYYQNKTNVGYAICFRMILEYEHTIVIQKLMQCNNPLPALILQEINRLEHLSHLHTKATYNPHKHKLSAIIYAINALSTDSPEETLTMIAHHIDRPNSLLYFSYRMSNSTTQSSIKLSQKLSMAAVKVKLEQLGITGQIVYAQLDNLERNTHSYCLFWQNNQQKLNDCLKEIQLLPYNCDEEALVEVLNNRDNALCYVLRPNKPQTIMPQFSPVTI